MKKVLKPWLPFENITIDEHFETYLDMIKHSQMTADFAAFTADKNDDFVAKYVNRSNLFSKHNLTFSNPKPTVLPNILFCGLITNLQVSR